MFLPARVAGRDPPRFHDWQCWGNNLRDARDGPRSRQRRRLPTGLRNLRNRSSLLYFFSGADAPSAPNPLVRLSEAIKTEADGTAPPSLRLLFRQLPLQMLQVGDRFLNLLPLLVDDCPAFA